jgi:hypothetical protein
LPIKTVLYSKRFGIDRTRATPGATSCKFRRASAPCAHGRRCSTLSRQFLSPVESGDRRELRRAQHQRVGGPRLNTGKAIGESDRIFGSRAQLPAVSRKKLIGQRQLVTSASDQLLTSQRVIKFVRLVPQADTERRLAQRHRRFLPQIALHTRELISSCRGSLPYRSRRS